MSEQKRVASIFDLARMCKYFVDTCEGCPLEKRTGPCPPFDFTEKDSDLILAWCDEHPQKTYAQDFFEKFPSCEKDLDGTPSICRSIVYGLHNCEYKPGKHICTNCWNEIIPEEETK